MNDQRKTKAQLIAEEGLVVLAQRAAAAADGARVVAEARHHAGHAHLAEVGVGHVDDGLAGLQLRVGRRDELPRGVEDDLGGELLVAMDAADQEHAWPRAIGLGPAQGQGEDRAALVRHAQRL